jgi:sarcosine oxidase
MAPPTYDICVVGLGALGSAALWQATLKQPSLRTIGIEQFSLGHVRGASHDTSRIVRTSYDSAPYVSLAKSAYRDWATLEAASGLKLLHVTGGLVFLPREGEKRTGQTTADYVRSLGAEGIECELLSGSEVRRRWPVFGGVDDEVEAVYTPDTGIAHAAKSVGAMQACARAGGATIWEDTPVLAIRPGVKGTVVKTGRGDIVARKVVLATDAWTNKLLKPLGAEIPLTVMQEQVTYFKPSDPAKFAAKSFPVWIHGGENWFYGFPTFGEPTIKAARDKSDNVMGVEERTFVHSEELLKQLESFMNGFVPDEGRKTLRTVTCQYAITPERQFVIGPLPEYPDVLVALGAGHAFKFAPAIGRVLAELALDGRTTDDVSMFAVPMPEGKGPLQSKL